MLSHQVYNVIHIIGIVALMAALGGGILLAIVQAGPEHRPARRVVGALHGVGAFLVLVGGFGMLARLDLPDNAFPPWLWVKLMIWLVLAFALYLVARRPQSARLVLVTLPVLGGLAAYMAIYKPF
jgi:hypothetical protein